MLLDTSAPAASFGADTTSMCHSPWPPSADQMTFGPDSPLLTPDGQHVIETLVNLREAAHPPSGPLDAFTLDIVNLRTGRVVTTLRQHSQLLYVLASDPSGSAVIAALANLPPYASGSRRLDRARSTLIQVPPDTIAIAW